MRSLKTISWLVSCSLLLFTLAVAEGTASAITPTPTPETPLSPALNWIFTGGPRGGIGYDIRINPLDDKIIWVTDAYAGAHQSRDGGFTWKAKNNGITARVGFTGDAIPIFSLTIDPNNPDTLWAGTQGMRGVFKSVDGGETWIEMDNGIPDMPNMEIRGITIDPSDSNTVYCGGNYMVEPTKNVQHGVLYKTIDGGQNWKLILDPKALVRWIIVDPTDHNVLYVSTGIFDRLAVKAEGVLKSYDGGQSWEQINTGLTNLVVGALAMHPTDPLTLLAGTGKDVYFADEPGEVYGGVFKTTDGGKTWRQVDPFQGIREVIQFSAVAFAPSNPDIVYADTGNIFMRSEDGGETWRVYDVGPDSGASGMESRGRPIALTVHPTDPNLLYMNSYDGGVFMSQDGGRTWRDASKGYSGSQVWNLTVQPKYPGFAMAAAKNGVYITMDGGENWEGRISTGWVIAVLAVASDPTNDYTFLLGQEIDGTIFKTRDAGMGWYRVLGPLGNNLPNQRRAIYRIAYAPSNPMVFYAATGIDTMTTFTPHHTVGTGVYKSEDGGETWHAVNAGLGNTRLNTLDLAIHPKDENTVYLGTLDFGVYKTTDGGESWQPARKGLRPSEIRSIAIDPHNPETVLAGADRDGIWRSTDGAATWRQISKGLPPEATIFSIVFDPVQPGIVYTADRLSGVYRSTNGGETWEVINNGLGMRAVNKLAISSDGLHLYAATEGNGVYRLDLNNQSPEVPAPIPTPTIIALSYRQPGEATLFSDDFEDENTDGWAMGRYGHKVWNLGDDGNNHALIGVRAGASAWITYSDELGTIESLECKFKLLQGILNVYYRDQGVIGRYYVSLGSDRIDLKKNYRRPQGGLVDDVLMHSPTDISNDTWHSLRIVGVENHLEIYLDGKKVMEYTRQEQPVFSGGVDFEYQGNYQVLLDDVVLKGYPLAVTPPSAFATPVPPASETPLPTTIAASQTSLLETSPTSSPTLNPTAPMNAPGATSWPLLIIALVVVLVIALILLRRGRKLAG